MNVNKNKKRVNKYKFSKDICLDINKLIKLDNYHGLIAVLFDYAIIAAFISLYFVSYYFYPLIILVIAARQGALSNLFHEAAHGRLTKDKTLNYILGTYFSGYLLFQEYNTYVDSHIKNHHIHIGDAQKDPDYSFHLQAGLYAQQSKKKFILEYVVKPFFLKGLFNYVKHIFVQRAPTLSVQKKGAIYMYSYLFVLLLVAYYVNVLKYIFLFWFVPFFTIFPIIGWFIDLVEHYPLVNENSTDLYMTRNRFSHWIEDFIFNIHSENFHLVHHLHPGIPFWNLKKAHNIFLKDDEYKRVNNAFGGIFISSNNNKSFVSEILNKKDSYLTNN